MLRTFLFSFYNNLLQFVRSSCVYDERRTSCSRTHRSNLNNRLIGAQPRAMSVDGRVAGDVTRGCGARGGAPAGRRRRAARATRRGPAAAARCYSRGPSAASVCEYRPTRSVRGRSSVVIGIDIVFLILLRKIF